MITRQFRHIHSQSLSCCPSPTKTSLTILSLCFCTRTSLIRGSDLLLCHALQDRVAIKQKDVQPFTSFEGLPTVENAQQAQLLHSIQDYLKEHDQVSN